MATLKDISRKLNLSVTQVSRALNDHSDVSEETKKRVRDAANALNYQPNLSARKLVSGRSGIVGLVLPSYYDKNLDSNLLATVNGLSAQFSARGMQFVLHMMRPDEDELEVYQKLISSGSLDGFVVIEPAIDDRRLKFLKKRGIPFVVHGRVGGRMDYAFYDIDNFGVTHQLTTYLGGLGHRRIALLNGVEPRNYAHDRLRGYRAALGSLGIDFKPELVRHGKMTESQGLIATIQMFAPNGPKPTAIFCGNILIAKGVYQALEALELSIPGDVSVVAHDDVLPDFRASAFYPALTVTRSSFRDSWEPLVEALEGAILGKPLGDLQKVAGFEFVARASSGPCRALY